MDRGKCSQTKYGYKVEKPNGKFLFYHKLSISNSGTTIEKIHTQAATITKIENANGGGKTSSTSTANSFQVSLAMKRRNEKEKLVRFIIKKF